MDTMFGALLVPNFNFSGLCCTYTFSVCFTLKLATMFFLRNSLCACLLGGLTLELATKRKMDEASAVSAPRPGVDEPTVTDWIHDQRKGLLGKFERRYGFDQGGNLI